LSQVKFLENRLRSWTPAQAEAMEEEIRRAVAPHPDPSELDCRILLEGEEHDLCVGIVLEHSGWGARFVVPFPSRDGEVLSSTRRVLRRLVLA
jgi:hypothetical protein